MKQYEFLDENGSFRLADGDNDLGLYFPLASEAGLKSCVTPILAGDSKVDQNHFVLEPESAENLNNNKSTRNFWVKTENGVWSACGSSAAAEVEKLTGNKDKSSVEAGLMWHTIKRSTKALELSSEISSFVIKDKNVEVMAVTITNDGQAAVCIEPTAAIPMYGRSADNIRDHRHVTSLLHRVSVDEYGIEIAPTLSFDERGHQLSDCRYFCLGFEENGVKPLGFIPEVAAFIGKSGSFAAPESIYKAAELVKAGECPSKVNVDGQEIVGAIRFNTATLEAGESVNYYILFGMTDRAVKPIDYVAEYMTGADVKKAFADTKAYWLTKSAVSYHTGSKEFDEFMKWVSFQPKLRELFGCSFLPHHDYGKGGRGWRDLWQDCLALLILNPTEVRSLLVSNFAGVRIDGTNATIIGNKPGEFKADRNSITRVWMDHGVWPLVTTKLYLDQTGDYSILKEKVKYFKDRQVMRGTAVDTSWNNEMWQQDLNGNEYEGTVLEHLLLQALSAFFEVGEHGNIRLRDADWNDAIDMASKKGESVAFTNAYAMNLMTLAEILTQLKAQGDTSVSVLKEMRKLMCVPQNYYGSPALMQQCLDDYSNSVFSKVSGEASEVDIDALISNLKEKANWIFNHLRQNEWITEGNDGWYNSYYDNNGNPVEGKDSNGNIRMMLTGQVFSIMAGTATDDQVKSIAKAADKYLYDEACGGYRLNTNFNELKTDMGRMFGFAFGEKENGAVFSHMAVMYANALYKRGFAREGFKSLNSLFKASMNFEVSRIYPGIPEYFGKDGRGLYHYLTGAASWYMLTVITEMFGVKGNAGDFTVAPQLLLEQFDESNMASISLEFLGKRIEVLIGNPEKLEVGDYKVKSASVNNKDVHTCDDIFRIKKDEFNSLFNEESNKVHIILGR